MQLQLAQEVLDKLEKMEPDVFQDLVNRDDYVLSEGDFKGRNVLDAGANVGLFSVIAAVSGAKTILAFEPNAASFGKLTDNCRQYPNIHPLRFAIHDGSQPACKTAGDGQVCTVTPDSAGDVPVVTLQQATALFPPSDNDLLLKMDIEGSEFPALYTDGGNGLRRFRTIMLETHSKQDPSQCDALNSFVIERGFRLVHAAGVFVFPGGTFSGQAVTKYERID